MKKYRTIDELDHRIESTVKRHVKHFYTDWKNYDRPKYMKLKGSADINDQAIILIARKCGTYLFSYGEIMNRNFPIDCIEYYFNSERENSHFYYIDIRNYKFEALKDDKITALINGTKSHLITKGVKTA